jgi:uncharacterized protein (TIGR00304 family)
MAQNALIVCDGNYATREWGWILVATELLLAMTSFTQAALWGNASYGGVIMIGPVPIVFGCSPETAAAAMLLFIVLMVSPFCSSGGEHDAALLTGMMLILLGLLVLL